MLGAATTKMRQMWLIDAEWIPIKDGNLSALELFLRHYTARESRKIRQFIGPGEKMALITPTADALFCWRKFIDDSGQQGVNCAVFRNESSVLSSHLILKAEAFAWERWPSQRLYTYVDPKKVRSSNPGFCFVAAGWKQCGISKSGKWIFEKMPPRLDTIRPLA